jgi:transcriptional regulator with XRE-family HTH domain
MSLRSGRHLKAARVLAGLTQKQLANEASLHLNSVKGWERHRDPIGGYAVDRMTETLKRRGVEYSEETHDGATIAVLRG